MVTRNSEWYDDPTAKDAITEADKKWDDLDKKRRKVVKLILTVCELSGFSIEGRLVLKHKETGKIWR